MKGQANHTEGLLLEDPSHHLERPQEDQELEKKEGSIPRPGSRNEIPDLSGQQISNHISEEDQDDGQEKPPNGPEVAIKKE
jgi:hypothetical protein